MKVLIVCSGNSGNINPFIKDQGEALEKQGIIISYFLIKGKGVNGYLKN
jgi:teichuronic acid biosynthesis glycosyltransferase TuaC